MQEVHHHRCILYVTKYLASSETGAGDVADFSMPFSSADGFSIVSVEDFALTPSTSANSFSADSVGAFTPFVSVDSFKTAISFFSVTAAISIEAVSTAANFTVEPLVLPLERFPAITERIASVSAFALASKFSMRWLTTLSICVSAAFAVVLLI